MRRYLAVAAVLITAIDWTSVHAGVTFEEAALAAGYTYGSPGVIDVQERNIDTLTGINNFTVAESVVANRNHISGIEAGNFQGLTNLQVLSLGENEISSIEGGDLQGLVSLRGLFLGCNRIGSIETGDFQGLANLQELELGFTEIRSIEPGSFIGLGNLRVLRLGYPLFGPQFPGACGQLDQIEAGVFSTLTTLQELWLEYHLISRIEASAFAGLTNLQELYLRNNEISSIGANAFAGLTSLQVLELEDNPLTHLNLSGADFETLIVFTLTDHSEFGSPHKVISADLSYVSLSDLAFTTIINELSCGHITSLDLRNADLSAVADLSPVYFWYGLHDLETVDFAFASLANVNDLAELVAGLEPHALDNLTISRDQWELMDLASQTCLSDWDALAANTLKIVPEPSTVVMLLVIGACITALPWGRLGRSA